MRARPGVAAASAPTRRVSSVVTRAIADGPDRRREDNNSNNNNNHRRDDEDAGVALPRRTALALAAVGLTTVGAPVAPARAIGFTKELKKKDVSDDDYLVSEPFDFRGSPHEGVRYYDLARGDGAKMEAGKTAVIHYTCRYRGLTAVSSREARTLGGNRTIAEPLEFKFGKLPSEYNKPLVRKTVVGIGAEVRVDPELRELYVVNTVFDGPADKAGIKPNDAIVSINGTGDLANVPISDIGALLVGDAGTDVELEVKRGGERAGGDVEKVTLTREATAVVPKKRVVEVEGGGGLFVGGSGPKPPPVVYVPQALAGMRVGGRRNIIVPADVGYADEGESEIPPGATFKLEVELLDIRNATA